MYPGYLSLKYVSRESYTTGRGSGAISDSALLARFSRAPSVRRLSGAAKGATANFAIFLRAGLDLDG